MEDTSCELGRDIFDNGSETCVGEVCLQCSDGIWLPEGFEFTTGSVKERSI